MLLSARFPSPAVPPSSIKSYDNITEYTHSTTLVPPTVLPKHYNVPFAIQHGYFRSVRYLLELNYDPNERDSQLRTPLILCAYVESDRWSSSLAQNLLEKGAKIALEDHARRNAMHHACAVQRAELVQMYLACLDFNIEAQDCEGNTCLHYVAITGNCQVAELLMRSAERMGIRLDRYVNREGCSAAVLALKYGHIECANQITHRDSDEFFVIPRPLSIYENPSTICDNAIITISTTEAPTKSRSRSNHSPSRRPKQPSSALPFGLLKIVFNDSDTGYSTRLASLCEQERQSQRSNHRKHEARQQPTTTINNIDRTKSTTVNGTRYCSTQVLVNDSQILSRTKKHARGDECDESSHSTTRVSPRSNLLTQQQQRLLHASVVKDPNSSFIQKALSKTRLSIDDISTIKSGGSRTEHDENRSKVNGTTTTHQLSNSTFNQSDNHTPRVMNPHLQRPKTSVQIHPVPSQLNSTNLQCAQLSSALPKKKLLPNDRVSATSTATKNSYSTHETDLATQPQSISPNRPISALPRSASKSVDLSCPIREATGPTSRYNKPEALFGLRPEELFCTDRHQPKIFDPQSTTKNDDGRRLKRSHLQKQQHIWQRDVDKLIDLYNIHNTSAYRHAAVPPASTVLTTSEVAAEATPAPRSRQPSATKQNATGTSSKSSNHSKQSTLASLNISRRNSVHRPPTKLTHA